MRLLKKLSIILIIITLSMAFLSACKSKKVDELEKEVEELTESIAPPPKDSKQVVEAYQIITDSDTQGPMLLTFSYDPAELPEGTNEENLY